MRQIFTLALAFGLAWPVAPLHAREILRLKPSSPWNVHYADDSCRLARVFGEGKQQVVVIFDQFVPGDSFRLLFVGDSFPLRRERAPLEGGLRFGPAEAETEITVSTGTYDKQRALIVNGSLRIGVPTEAEKAAHSEVQRNGIQLAFPPIGQAREAAATWLELSKILRTDLVLETGPMDKPLAALRECSWDTVKMWGLDVEQQKTLTRKPVPKRGPAHWFNPDDYPREMLRRGYQGIINFRIMVGADGKPASCHIQDSTRPKDFDDVVCKVVMRHARFDPALDALGKPVPSFWVSTVIFRLQ